VTVLRYIEGHKMREAADAMGSPKRSTHEFVQRIAEVKVSKHD
jgi:DNA-directed RNA polymerase specialized sigma24 family protein